MAIESYVENILKSPELTFRKIVSKIVQKSDKSAKIELIRQHIEVDEILFAAIKSILNDLRLEEGMVSQFLYRYFNIELVKNKKREQLIILGTELKTQYSRLKREQNSVDIHILNLTLSLDNLKRLKDAFDNKRDSLQRDKEINKSDAFIKKLNSTIDELSKYRDALKQKSLKLSETERLYLNLYRQIPRYYELQEESMITLLASPKKQKRFSWS
jgi:predicted RNase H-like nuclease (RuvC/YqgF family)